MRVGLEGGCREDEYAARAARRGAREFRMLSLQGCQSSVAGSLGRCMGSNKKQGLLLFFHTLSYHIEMGTHQAPETVVYSDRYVPLTSW